MANSSILIQFTAVPAHDEVLNIMEESIGYSIFQTFQYNRTTVGETAIPTHLNSPSRYVGFISENYKDAVNLDYNSTGLFTITWENGAVNSGIGSVLITANFPGAIFSIDLVSAPVTVTINNEIETEPPVDPVFSFLPSNLSFVHNQNTDRPFQNIVLTGNLWKLKAKPNFILTTSTPGVSIVSVTDSEGTYFVASGSGNASISVALSEYYDSDAVFTGTDLAGSFNVLKNDVQFGVINYTVTVSRLSDFFQIPYPSGHKAFTLDPIFFNFQSAYTDTYFQFDALIKTYDFFTNDMIENIIPQKIVLFKGKAKVNLGKVIHRLMRKFSEVNDSLLQYQFANVQLSVAEKLILDNSIIRSGISADILFVAGLSRGITNFGFLEFNSKPNRVTQKSFAYLNILIPAGIFELRTFKNGTLINTEALPTNATTTLCKKVLFNTYIQGDVIEYVIDIVGENNTDAPRKTFCLFPKGNYSNMIVWENEFKMQTAIECTGGATLDPELEFQSQKVYQNLVETLEHLSSSKEVKLYMDTGWLLFTDIDTVESLMRSKRAWIIQGEKEISLRPIGKKLPKQDYDNELISFPLEFTINRAYDEETYTL
jgi:hypothetical protein